MITRPIAPFVDITAEDGAKVISPLTSWQATITYPLTNSKSTVSNTLSRLQQSVRQAQTDHLAGTTDSSELIHFWEQSTDIWCSENLTKITGYKATGSLASWVTPDGTNTVIHIAACSPDNHLLVFYLSTRDRTWKVVDITAKTGREIIGGLSSWQTPNGTLNIEHVSGRDEQGNLYVFWWSPANDWQSVSITAKTGILINSDVTNWQVRRRKVLTEYLAATSSEKNNIVVFSWTSATDWQAQVTEHRAFGGVSAWVTDNDAEHLSSVGEDGTVYALWRRNGQIWQTVNITEITSQRAHITRPMPYQLRDGNETVELLGALGSNGHALIYWWKPSRDWQALDLTDLTGQSISTRPEVWVSNTGGRVSEHLAAVDTSGHVFVFHSYDQPRIWTDTICNSYKGIPRTRNVRKRVLTILWDPHYPGIPKPEIAKITEQLEKMNQFFAENSGGTFGIQNIGVLGWYDADHPLEWYDNNWAHDKAGAAILAAAADFNFAAFDDNGDDVLSPDELAIIFAHPGGPGGLVRSGSREVRDLDGSELRIDGVRIKECVEVAIGHPEPDFSVVAHELVQLLFHLPDMYPVTKEYGWIFTPTAASIYSLLDNAYNQTHIDGFNKMKLGWAHPRLILRSVYTAIPDVETRHRVLVLVDPNRSLSEYFIVENRWCGTSFDAKLADQGLAVWHIMEDEDVYNSSPPPPTVNIDEWNAFGSNDWGRKAIRMIRPVLQPPLDDRYALWNARQGHLLDTAQDLYNPALRWGDGTPSGFCIRSIQPPSSNVIVHITVTWQAG